MQKSIKIPCRIPILNRRTIRPVASLSPPQVFSISSAVMVPVYAMMVAQPQSKLTRKLVIDSPILPITLGLVYIALLVQGFQTTFPLPKTILSQAPWSISALNLAEIFSNSLITCIAWLHLLLVDFLQARWILIDGQERSVLTSHSVALSFFVGPLGLLSHILTRVLCRR